MNATLDLDAIAALCASDGADPGALAEHVPALLAMARRAVAIEPHLATLREALHEAECRLADLESAARHGAVVTQAMAARRLEIEALRAVLGAHALTDELARRREMNGRTAETPHAKCRRWARLEAVAHDMFERHEIDFALYRSIFTSRPAPCEDHSCSTCYRQRTP